jgi:hypothetical protein
MSYHVEVIISTVTDMLFNWTTKSQKPYLRVLLVIIMAGVPGFEPGQCQSQSLMPYRLAIPQYGMVVLYEAFTIVQP